MSGLPAGPATLIIELLVAFLLIGGGVITLIGSLGLLRFRDFFQRMHGPAMGNTLGAICILAASLLYFSVSRQRVLVHEVLIVLFLLMTAPVTGMLLARAALYRQRSTATPDDTPDAVVTADAAASPHGAATPTPSVTQPRQASSDGSPAAFGDPP